LLPPEIVVSDKGRSLACAACWYSARSSPLADANERKSLRINVADTIPTAPGIPDSPPTCMINAGQRLRPTIDFRNATTPTRRRKPPGVLGVEIHIKITSPGEPAPLDPAKFAYHGMATASPYRIDVAGTDGNRIVHYILRWLNTRGQKGPWSGSRRNLGPQFENGSPRFVQFSTEPECLLCLALLGENTYWFSRRTNTGVTQVFADWNNSSRVRGGQTH
jgi:hypothetical protein